MTMNEGTEVVPPESGNSEELSYRVTVITYRMNRDFGNRILVRQAIESQSK